MVGQTESSIGDELSRIYRSRVRNQHRKAIHSLLFETLRGVEVRAFAIASKLCKNCISGLFSFRIFLVSVIRSISGRIAVEERKCGELN